MIKISIRFLILIGDLEDLEDLEEEVVDYLCHHRRHRLSPFRELKGGKCSFFFAYMNL